MNSRHQLDDDISLLFSSRCSIDEFLKDGMEVFDCFISYTDYLKFEQNYSDMHRTNPQTCQTPCLLDPSQCKPNGSEDKLPIKAVSVSLKQIQQFQNIQIQLDDQQIATGIELQSMQKLTPCKEEQVFKNFYTGLDSQIGSEDHGSSSYSSTDSHMINEQNSFTFLQNFSRPQRIKPKKLQKKQSSTTNKTSKSPRKQKNTQPKTQRLICFMTRYYFNKNFSQYLKRKIAEKLDGDSKIFETLSVERKIELIDEIIADLEGYSMTMHYSVRNGKWFKGFTDEEQLNIQDLFEKVVRRTYQIKLQTNKRRILGQEVQGPEGHKYLDLQGEKEFQRAFEEILQGQQYYESLVSCDFQRRLQKQLQR